LKEYDKIFQKISGLGTRNWEFIKFQVPKYKLLDICKTAENNSYI